jgi:transposase
MPSCKIIALPQPESKPMPANLLNLPSYIVLSLVENDHDYHIDVETKQPPTQCPVCHSEKIRGFGRREQMIKDLPMHGKRVGVYISTRRMQCQKCSDAQGKAVTFSETLPDVDENRAMTRRLLTWIGKQCTERTNSSIAKEVGVVEGTVRAIFKDYVEELEKTFKYDTPKWMGIDEIHLIKPRGVITNLQNNTMFDMLKNRNKDTMIHYLSNLKDRDRIQYVAMDMWQPYRDACLIVLPKAKVIIDKFHVVKMANEAVEKIRKGLRERLTMKEKRGLMHDRFVLLKRENQLTDEESLKLSGWIKNYAELGMAYRLKEDFYKIYDCTSADEAQGMYLDWKSRITPEVEDAFHDLVRAWDNWAPWILEYFDHPITNAYTESLNGLIRIMNRVGRGYSFEALRAKILFAEGAMKAQNAKPKFERKEQQPRPPKPVRNLTLGRVAMEPPANAPCYGLASPGDWDDVMMYSPPKSTQTGEKEKCYGPDISTLTRMIENGEL